jgi:hypothetical protein
MDQPTQELHLGTDCIEHLVAPTLRLAARRTGAVPAVRPAFVPGGRRRETTTLSSDAGP